MRAIAEAERAEGENSCDKIKQTQQQKHVLWNRLLRMKTAATAESSARRGRETAVTAEYEGREAKQS